MQALLDLVWHDGSVEEGVLSVYVSALRKSLGDSGETATYIETVPRAGYRFSANVSRRAVAAEPLSMKWPIGVLPAKPEVSELIGRGRGCLMAASRSEVPRAVGGVSIGNCPRSLLRGRTRGWKLWWNV